MKYVEIYVEFVDFNEMKNANNYADNFYEILLKMALTSVALKLDTQCT